jgi:hypothetical protein
MRSTRTAVVDFARLARFAIHATPAHVLEFLAERQLLAAAFLVLVACGSPSEIQSTSHELAAHADIEMLSDVALREALSTRVGNHTRLDYDDARDVLFTDPELLVDGLLECIYTGRRTLPDGTRIPGGFNTEHTWPQAGAWEARSDLHHIFPVDLEANNARGSWPFGAAPCLHGGDGPCSFDVGGSALGRIPGGSERFEVRPEKRGDVARAMFYVSVRYDMRIDAEEESALRAWHAEDSVDAFERHRNDVVETYQHNRNPFIDRPDFVARISDF